MATAQATLSIVLVLHNERRQVKRMDVVEAESYTFDEEGSLVVKVADITNEMRIALSET